MGSLFLDKDPATDIIGDGPEAVAHKLTWRHDFSSFLGVDVTGLEGATPGVGEGEAFKDTDLKGPMAGVGAGRKGDGFKEALRSTTLGMVVGFAGADSSVSGSANGVGMAFVGATVAIGRGVSGALVPQFGSFQKGTLSRAARTARCLWCRSWSGCAEVRIIKSVSMRARRRRSVVMLCIGSCMLVLLFSMF